MLYLSPVPNGEPCSCVVRSYGPSAYVDSAHQTGVGGIGLRNCFDVAVGEVGQVASNGKHEYAS